MNIITWYNLARLKWTSCQICFSMFHLFFLHKSMQDIRCWTCRIYVFSCMWIFIRRYNKDTWEFKHVQPLEAFLGIGRSSIYIDLKTCKHLYIYKTCVVLMCFSLKPFFPARNITNKQKWTCPIGCTTIHPKASALHVLLIYRANPEAMDIDGWVKD